MLLTESGAREKWCPQARIARREIVHPNTGEVGIVGGCNRDALGGAHNPASCRCLGSDCMAWRWAGWRNKTYGTVAPCPDPVERDGERLGFCGLAGKPDMGRAAS